MKLEAEKVKVAEQSRDSSCTESVDDVEELSLIPPIQTNYRDYLAEVWNSYNPPVAEEDIRSGLSRQEEIAASICWEAYKEILASAAAALEVKSLKKKHGVTGSCTISAE